MRTKSELRGVIAAIVTPFTGDGKLSGKDVRIHYCPNDIYSNKTAGRRNGMVYPPTTG